MEDSADPDQMASGKPSDLDLHCFPRIYLVSAPAKWSRTILEEF